MNRCSGNLESFPESVCAVTCKLFIVAAFRDPEQTVAIGEASRNACCVIVTESTCTAYYVPSCSHFYRLLWFGDDYKSIEIVVRRDEYRKIMHQLLLLITSARSCTLDHNKQVRRCTCISRLDSR
jgi:hypothetical protein